MGAGRRPVGVYIDPRVDREIEHLSVDTGKTKSELYELGARIVIELVRDGGISGELGEEIARLREALSEAARAEARG